MALMPKRVMYRKTQRRRIKGSATSGNYVAYGDYGLMAMEPGWIKANVLEAARVVLSRALGTDGRYWTRIFPHKPVTAKPAETRMGSGKGEVVFWAAVVKPGTIMFELAGVPENVAREIFRKQSGKLPIRVKFIARRPTV